MNRRHAAVISLFLAFAVVLGAVATVRTSRLGATATTPKLSARQLAARQHRLDRVDAALRKAARQKPPALPALPAAPAGPATQLASATAPRTIYVRPKPIVRVIHRHGGEGEHEHGGDSEGGGGGFDD